MGRKGVYEFRGYPSESLDGPRGRLIQCREQISIEHPRTASAQTASVLLSIELERARYANALGESETLREALTAAAGYAAAMTVRARLADGTVELSLPDRPTLVLPPGDTHCSPPLWTDGLFCAVAVRDRFAQSLLCHPIALHHVSDECRRSGGKIGVEAFWPDYMTALAAWATGHDDVIERSRHALAEMKSAHTGALDRSTLLATDGQVLHLLSDLGSFGEASWPTRIDAAVGVFHDSFSNEAIGTQTTGLLPLGLLALSARAYDLGLGLPSETPYLPGELITAPEHPNATRIDVRFDRRTILSADEAHWFLDLQGYPRKDRSHRLVAEGDQMLAKYRLPAAFGLPEASAEFTLADTLDGAGPPALDAGELVMLADTLSQQVAIDASSLSDAERILLSDAVACLDAALLRLPTDGSELPSSALTSAAGRQHYEQEPARFRRDRLKAYRDALAALLNPENNAMHEPISEDDARTTALAICATVRAEALPIIEALRADYEGELQAKLRPRDDDYTKVFTANAAKRAKAAYERAWSRGLRVDFPTDAQTETTCDVAPAGMFGEANELSRSFPGGYRSIAPLLNPHRVWVCWQYRRPGADAGLTYDGLVWIDDHWSWFPKPYRYLR